MFCQRKSSILFLQTEGYDTNWVFVGTNQLVSLTDLPEGSYKFRVRTTRDFKTMD